MNKFREWYLRKYKKETPWKYVEKSYVMQLVRIESMFTSFLKVFQLFKKLVFYSTLKHMKCIVYFPSLI